MHRSEAVGVDRTEVTMSGSDTLQRDATRGITDSEDLTSRDAGEGRKGRALSSSEVNPCSTEASTLGIRNNLCVPGSATPAFRAVARWDRLVSEECTLSAMGARGEETSPEPRLPQSHHAPERMEAPRSSTAASSMSGGTDPLVQADDSRRQEQLLMTRLMDIPELPQLESERGYYAETLS